MRIAVVGSAGLTLYAAAHLLSGAHNINIVDSHFPSIHKKSNIVEVSKVIETTVYDLEVASSIDDELIDKRTWFTDKSKIVKQHNLSRAILSKMGIPP